MAPYIQSAWEGIKPAFESAGNLISQVVGIIVPVLQVLWSGVQSVFGFLAPYLPTVWSIISTAFSVAGTVISTVIDFISCVLSVLQHLLYQQSGM